MGGDCFEFRFMEFCRMIPTELLPYAETDITPGTSTKKPRLSRLGIP